MLLDVVNTKRNKKKNSEEMSGIVNHHLNKKNSVQKLLIQNLVGSSQLVNSTIW
jgi:hypothetical protein